MKEIEQSEEEIQAVLETALRKKCLVDLVILTPDGELKLRPNLLVEEIEGDILMMSYLDDEGKLAEVIPLEMFRVKGAKIKS
ncbi:hypothetical protein AMJ47_03160 [Parcubacteria bacterium DG_72]|nr:MAG: hypothetical protein AMJ47_03160 [Parcubacteria bacterium DG_72]